MGQNNRGGITLELILALVSSVVAAIAYAHINFVTYREVAPRLDRIESKIDKLSEAAIGR